jgi:hypothetical protein
VTASDKRPHEKLYFNAVLNLNSKYIIKSPLNVGGKLKLGALI